MYVRAQTNDIHTPAHIERKSQLALKRTNRTPSSIQTLVDCAVSVVVLILSRCYSRSQHTYTRLEFQSVGPPVKRVLNRRIEKTLIIRVFNQFVVNSKGFVFGFSILSVCIEKKSGKLRE